MEVPDGGLASFLSATVGDWADTPESVPVTGIGGIRSVADKLAEYGRYEDTYMVHAAQGETVIPMAVFDENPRLKESLFAQMREMGVDPEQYVVGNELNSINPVTGQPEFFLKKLFKGLKKAVKSVVKVVKKFAPIILSVALSTVMGPIAGSALGSGIGTLLQGGSLKDALKMGAIGGLTAGLFKGVQGGIQGAKAGTGFGAGFKSGVSSGLPGATAAQAATANQAVAQSNNALLPQPVAPAGSLTVNPAANTTAVMGPIQGQASASSGVNVPAKYANIPSVTATAPAPAVNTVMTPLNTDLFAPGTTTPGMGVGATANSSAVAPNATRTLTADDILAELGGDPNATTSVTAAAGEAAGEAAGGASAVPQGIETLTEAQLTKLKTPGFGESIKDMFAPGNKGFLEAGRDAFFPGKVSPQSLVKTQLGLPATAGTDAMNAAIQERGITKTLQELITDATTQIAQDNMNPGFLRRFAPGIAAGTGILGLTGGFETPEMEEAGDPFGMGGNTGFDLLEQYPEQYRMFSQGAPYTVPPVGTVAMGGTIDHFPRRNGSIAGPGTGTSDDIPAMLSDGEFVMTAQAVRGAGNGDRRQGVKRMYDVMRSFEGAA